MNSLSIILVLAARAAAFSPASKADLQSAVNEWLFNSQSANKTYGPINSWDTSAITDLSEMFCGDSPDQSRACNLEAQNFNDYIGAWDTASTPPGIMLYIR